VCAQSFGWAISELEGHAALSAVFSNFNLLTVGSFIYGFVASMIYGWTAACSSSISGRC
jgi:hypothetical protein